MDTINVHIEVVITASPALEKLLLEIARAIVAHDREAADAEMARIVKAAERKEQ